MKKLYLSITLLGMFILMFAISMIPTQAYTFNGSYDFSNVDLNESFTELNGASLNDLFDYDYLETLPLIEWNGYRNKYELVNGVITFNEYIYIDLDYKNLFDKTLIYDDVYISDFDGGFVFNSNYKSSQYISVKPNTDYYLTIPFTPFGGNALVGFDINMNFVSVLDNGGVGNQQFTTPSNVRYIRFGINDFTNLNDIQLEEGTIGTNVVGFNILSEVYRLNTTPTQNIDLTQSLTLYNLENINIDLLNYYFAVFILNKYNLPVGDLWNYAYTAGTVQGYEDGYYEGQSDYHYGNFYSIYDFMESDAYITGYNEGMDYAATNNITLLSLFQLIIGVAMSMLGFIINIELFGISIASVLGTLSIGIAIIWTLKLIRG